MRMKGSSSGRTAAVHEHVRWARAFLKLREVAQLGTACQEQCSTAPNCAIRTYKGRHCESKLQRGGSTCEALGCRIIRWRTPQRTWRWRTLR